MTTSLSVLNASGDLTLTWDHADPEAVARARAEVGRLAAAGYSFFLVDGTPVDAIAAGAGTLLVRRLEPQELLEPPAPEEPAPAPKRRGRPPKADRQAVAVRPLRGG